MIHIGGEASSFKKARELAQELIDSGAALEKFRETVEYQGGDSSFIDDYKQSCQQLNEKASNKSP